MGRSTGGCKNEEDPLRQGRGLRTHIISIVRDTKGVPMVALIFRDETLWPRFVRTLLHRTEAIAKEDGWADKCTHTAK